MLAGSPILIPFVAAKNKRFKAGRIKADISNKTRIDQAKPLDLPELDRLELTILVEEKAQKGFLGDAGVSYLFKTDKGSLLYDLGFGPERPTLTHNAAKLGFTLDQAEALAISHLHPDHMGGMKASSKKQVTYPKELGSAGFKTCFLPDKAEAKGFKPKIVMEPGLLTGGLGTTGPLARSLFFMGYTEEQAIVARLKGKGLVVFTGCGHPTAEVILKMARRLGDEPIYAFGGGLHFPITTGRGNKLGIQFQQIIGTGKPPWDPISDKELTNTIKAINQVGPQKVFLSAHDTCDHAIDRFRNELKSQTTVLEAGGTYKI